MGPAQLREVLQAGINDHGTLLWQEQAERQQRVGSLCVCGVVGLGWSWGQACDQDGGSMWGCTARGCC